MRLKGTLILCSIFFIFSGVQAQVMDLPACIGKALDGNLDLRVAEVEAQRINQSTRQYRGNFLPKIDADASYFQYLDNYPVYFFPESEGNILSGGGSTGSYPVQLGQRQNFSTGLDIEQPLFDFRLLRSKEVMSETSRTADLQRKLTEEEITYEVAKAYFDLALLYKDLELLQAGMERIRKNKEILESTLRAELASADDRDELELNLIDLELNQSRIEGGIKLREDYLKMLMGIDPGENLEINQDYNIRLPAENIETSTSVRNQLLDSRIQLESLKNDMTRLERYPSLDLFLRMRWLQQADNGLFSSTTDWYNLHTAGISLSVPIFDGMTVKNQRDLSELNTEKMKIQQQKLQEGEKMELERALQDLEIAKESVEAANRKLEIRQGLRSRSALRYEKGIEPLKDLLENENELNRATLELHKRELELNLAKLELLKKSGQISMIGQKP